MRIVTYRARIKPRTRDKIFYIVVKGDTYPIKEELKKMGFKWDYASRGWIKEAGINLGFDELMTMLQEIATKINATIQDPLAKYPPHLREAVFKH